MKRRVILWSVVGLAVACGWVLYAWVTQPNPGLSRSVVVAITAPASLLGREMPLKFYWFILLNGAGYALLGWMLELARPKTARVV